MAEGVVQAGVDSSVRAAFFPVAVDALESQELELDLYLMHGGREPVLYRSVGSMYSMADCVKLGDRGVKHLYVPIGQHRAFQRLTLRRLTAAWEDPEIERDERVRIVRGCCGKMIDDLMSFPHVPGIARTIGQIAIRFGDWCVAEPGRFGELFDLSGRAYETTGHMINVGVGSGLLCAEMRGPNTPGLRDVLQGGLVHDIGKRDIPRAVLDKEGKLSDDEWTLLREHPTIGVGLLACQQGVTGTALEITRDHHERLDGRGYPAGLKAAQIPSSARIAAVVDIFDALASSRPHRAAIPPRRVLDSMREEAGTVLDRGAFEAWERVVDRLIERDPARCVPDNATGETPRLRAMIPSAPKQAVVRHQPESDARSMREQACDLSVRVSGLPSGSAAVEGRMVAVSHSGGMRLVLQGAVPAGSVLRVEINGWPTVLAWVRNRSFGPGGEPMVECVLTGVLRRAS